MFVSVTINCCSQKIEDGDMRIGLFLDPPYGLLAYAAVIEVLYQVKNRSADLQLSWETIGLTDEPIVSSSGHKTIPDCSIDSDQTYDLIMIFGVSSGKPEKALINWLKAQARKGTTLGGIISGTWVLAWAGLLTDYRCTVHWQDLEAFRETFPKINVCTNLYVIDNKRISCSGGHAAADMMLYYLSDSVSSKSLMEVAEALIHEHIRSPDNQQRISLRARLGTSNARVIALAQYLETSDYTDASIKGFCDAHGVSVRWMEKLFKKHIGKGPKAYQMEHRQFRARELLNNTDLAIGEIAAILEYASSAYFSTDFKKHNECTPSVFRNRGVNRA